MTYRRPPRLCDECYTGAQRIFFTMCTFERKHHFSNRDFGANVTEHLLRTATARDIEVIAYCFMPDHVHLLVAGKSASANSKRFADVFRQVSGFHFRRQRDERLWQEGYYDHVLREEEATIPVARYIVLNPVRAGLCDEASSYRFWVPLDMSCRNS